MSICLSNLILAFWRYHLFFNFTSSMPLGIWKDGGKVEALSSMRGKAILFCPPDTEVFRWARSQGILSPGRCPGDYTPLLKEVVGLPGDLVEYVDDGYSVNGRRVANSKIQPLDLGFKPAFYSHLVVPDGYVWLMSSYSAQSFDSRYFGPVETSHLQRIVKPLFIFR